MLWYTLKNAFRKAPREPEQSVDVRVRLMINEGRLEDAFAILSTRDSSLELAEEERLALLGEVHYHRKEPAEAEACFHAALHLRPSQAEGHYGLSLLYYDMDRPEDALAHIQYARNMRPSNARILAQTGLCYIALKDYSNARDALRQATLLDPDNVPALNNLGIALHATNDLEGALYYFRRALSLQPSYDPALTNIRNLYGFDSSTISFDVSSGTAMTGTETDRNNSDGPQMVDEAEISRLEHQVDLFPDDISAVGQLLENYLTALRLEDARDTLHVALARNSDSVPLLAQAGRIAHMLGQLNQATTNYQKALEFDPAHLDALRGFSQVLRDLGRMEDALEHMQRAALHDDGISTLMQLAAAQANACRYEACLSTCDVIEERDPSLTPFLLTNRAVSHAFLGHFETAMAVVDRLQQLDAKNPGLRCFIGILNLMNERYEEGWSGYRYRFLMESNDQRILPFPRWQGEDISGKTVLVLAEQGLGDQVMFSSCLSDLLACRPSRVLLEAHVRVAKTLERSFPDVQVIHSGQNKQLDWYETGLAPDYYVHIADLPYFFRRKKEDFPPHKGYLVADPERIKYWRERMQQVNNLPKIGISWRGGLQKTRQRIRSLDIHRLQSLIAEPSVQFVNLQYGDVETELALFEADTGLKIQQFPDAISDLDEFAALISSLDLVITVCNTTVHYTGALGQPCWVLAPHVPEWRYGLSGPNMRWYPTVRMFRQPIADEWDSVIRQILLSLDDWRANFNAKPVETCPEWHETC